VDTDGRKVGRAVSKRCRVDWDEGRTIRDEGKRDDGKGHRSGSPRHGRPEGEDDKLVGSGEESVGHLQGCRLRARHPPNTARRRLLSYFLLLQLHSSSSSSSFLPPPHQNSLPRSLSLRQQNLLLSPFHLRRRHLPPTDSYPALALPFPCLSPCRSTKASGNESS
jgi:hypothetical protein